MIKLYHRRVTETVDGAVSGVLAVSRVSTVLGSSFPFLSFHRSLIMSRSPPYNPNFFNNAAAASPASNRMAPPYSQRQPNSTAASAASSTASLLPSRGPAQAAPSPNNFPRSTPSLKSVASNASLTSVCVLLEAMTMIQCVT